MNEDVNLSIYLAVWPNGEFSLTRAPNEDVAVSRLDAIADPTTAKFARYDGMLTLNASWDIEGKEGIESLYESGCGFPAADPTFFDQSSELLSAVLELGFPHLKSYYESIGREKEKEPSYDEAKAALKLDIEEFPESPDSAPSGGELIDILGAL
jgi:hypothetical protein